MVLVVNLGQIRDISNLGQILGLTPINSRFTVWRINRGQPLKNGQNLKNRQLTAKTWLDVAKMLFIRVYKLVQGRL